MAWRCRFLTVHPTHWLVSTQVAGPDHFVDQVVSHLTLTKGYPEDCVVYF